jgi:hypothetical protein
VEVMEAAVVGPREVERNGRPARLVAAAITLCVMAASAAAGAVLMVVGLVKASQEAELLGAMASVTFASAFAAVAVFYAVMGLYTFRGERGIRAVTNVLIGANAVVLVLVALWTGDWRIRSVVLACLVPVMLVLALVNGLPPARRAAARPAPGHRLDDRPETDRMVS